MSRGCPRKENVRQGKKWDLGWGSILRKAHGGREPDMVRNQKEADSVCQPEHKGASNRNGLWWNLNPIENYWKGIEKFKASLGRPRKQQESIQLKSITNIVAHSNLAGILQYPGHVQMSPLPPWWTFSPVFYSPILLPPVRHLWLANNALIPWVAGENLHLVFSASMVGCRLLLIKI